MFLYALYDKIDFRAILELLRIYHDIAGTTGAEHPEQMFWFTHTEQMFYIKKYPPFLVSIFSCVSKSQKSRKSQKSQKLQKSRELIIPQSR